jgi:hypothetical protein
MPTTPAGNVVTMPSVIGAPLVALSSVSSDVRTMLSDGERSVTRLTHADNFPREGAGWRRAECKTSLLILYSIVGPCENLYLNEAF